MTGIIQKLWAALIGVLCGSLTFALFTAGHTVIAIFMVCITVFSVYIFLSPKAYPYRYMYPGLMTFLFFMILPTVFIIAIGFTNLGTGNLMSKEDVFLQHLEESFVTDEHPELLFSIVQTGENLSTNNASLEIIVKPENEAQRDHSVYWYYGVVSLDRRDGTVELVPFMQSPLATISGGIQSLPRAELFNLMATLKKFTFRLPTGVLYRPFKIGAMAEPRFEVAAEFKLRDRFTGEIYSPDDRRGVFSNAQEALTGGYYTAVGFKNYTSLVTHEGLKNSFFKIFSWSFMWALLSVFLTFSVGIMLALMLNSKFLAGKMFYRILLIIPYAIPFFISVLVFKGLLNTEFGMINDVLVRLGLDRINWLGDPTMAKASCLLVNLWLGFPYMMLVTTGILQAIPENLFEAAAIDGASRWSTFWYITLPLVFSAVGPLLVGSFAFSFNNFAVIYLLNQGLPPILGSITPAGETDILISYTYKLAFAGGGRQDLGLASAVAVLVFMIITVITLINFKLFGVFKDDKQR